MLLTSAQAIHWTTGPNGFEGVTYELKIENPKLLEVEIVSFWVGGKLKNIASKTSNAEFVVSLTESKNSPADVLENAANPTEQEAAGIFKYNINGKEYFWIISEFEHQTPSHDHLPE
jgi:hypothetical protein